MIRKPEELIQPIKEAVDRKAVVFSHILMAFTITLHTILDPRAFDYQIAIAVGMSIGAIILGYLRFFDFARLNNRPRLYLSFYYILIFAGFTFVSDPATPYITGFFLVVLLSNLYYGIVGVRSVIIMLAVASVIKYFFLLNTIGLNTIDKLNIVVTFLIFLAVCSIFVNIQKVFDWDRARLKDALKESDIEQKRLSTLINNMTESVLVLNREGVISLYNAATLGLFDTNTSLLGKKPEDFIKLEDDQSRPVHIQDLLPKDTNPQGRNDIFINYGKDDTAALSITVTPLHTSYGKEENETSYIMTMRDITREKSLEEERNEFISVISHELRTPVTVTEASISNAMFVNDKSHGNEEIGKSLKTAHDQSLFLANMLNDLSTFARAEQDKLELSLGEVIPLELINSLRDDYEEEAKNKGIQIEAILDEHSPPVIISSQLYIREILQNFVTNAIKYSDKGKIILKAEPSVEGLKFSVSDDGIGIATADQNKVFNKFFRAENFRTRSSGGTGLGLYIVRKLAKLISARFELQSELGKGSTFSLFVPDLHTQFMEQQLAGPAIQLKSNTDEQAAA